MAMEVVGKTSIIGMVIGGRAARACDVCGKERARWYCAADVAYLCERCDGSVHTANAVAKRHERVRLGPNGAPMKVKRSYSSSINVKTEAPSHPVIYNNNPRKRPRSIRRHSPRYSASRDLNAKSSSISEKLINISDVKIKAEPCSPDGEVEVPDHAASLLESLFDLRELPDDHLFLHEVPIYMPSDQNLPLFNCDEDKKPILCDQTLPLFNCDEDKKPILCDNRADSTYTSATISSDYAQGETCTGLLGHSSSAEESLDFLVSVNCTGIEHFLDSENDLPDLEVDIDCVLNGNQDGKGGQMASMVSIDMLHFHPSHYNDGSNVHANDKNDHGNENSDHANDEDYDDHHNAGHGELCFNASCESPRSWLCKAKVESPPELDMTELDTDALLSEKLDCENFHESQNRFKLGLNLNFEDVLNVWSDRGTLWMDGHRPDESSLDFLGGWLVPEVNYNSGGSSNSTGEQAGRQVPVFSSSRHGEGGGGGGGGSGRVAREAIVMRYREKRRLRLFSKKIRYEVRKLNAEKRPRMKGRFVKRTPGILT